MKNLLLRQEVRTAPSSPFSVIRALVNGPRAALGIKKHILLKVTIDDMQTTLWATRL